MPTPRRYPNQAERQAAYRLRLTAAREQGFQVKGPTLLAGNPHPPWRAPMGTPTSSGSGLAANGVGGMQSYQEQRSDAWRESERGERMVELVWALEEIVAALGLNPSPW